MRKIELDVKKVLPLLLAVVLGLLLILIGPVDAFYHGFFSDTVEYEDIFQENLIGVVDLSKRDYTLCFSPARRGFAGFEILLTNHTVGDTGTLILTVSDDNGKQIDKVFVNLEEVFPEKWYKVQTVAKMKKGEIYTLMIHSENCSASPQMQLVDSDYLGEESNDDSLLIGYAYQNPTFTVQERVFITILLVALETAIFSVMVSEQKKKMLQQVALFFVLVTLMGWNFQYGSLDPQNEMFVGFQDDSETLITGTIMAREDGIYDYSGFNLGRYTDINGYIMYYVDPVAFETNEIWKAGYHREIPGTIRIDSSRYTRQTASPGNWVQFSNEDMFQIEHAEDDGNCIVLTLNTNKILREAKYGKLSELVFFDSEGNELPKGRLDSYYSQFGFQAKVFRMLSYFMSLDSMHMLCSLAVATVLVIICFLIKKKYNFLFASIFYVVFLLSPWIVSFANDLYWVEFTWFIPMMIGLVCSLNIRSRMWRVLCYIAACASIALKCLCGYEYISSIMMGLIAFLLVDFVEAMSRKDRQMQWLIFRTVFFLGIAALAGFVLAILFHAKLRGYGDVFQGLESIIFEDAFKRTVGSNLNVMEQGSELAALTASVWETVCEYFSFRTQIIAGVDGNMFGILWLMPIAIFVIDGVQKRLDYRKIALYIVFFLTSMSWFVLAKAHSYVHLHMNYVLWYFGFVQTCFYIILSKIYEILHQPRV